MAKQIAVIGGGASGIMAAITAARNGAKVTIYEKNTRIGKKILATGNGKCNLSNLSFGETDYHSHEMNKVMKVFEQFDVNDTIYFFRELGLLIKNKNGYLYPAAEQAAVVLDILRLEIANQNISVVTQASVQDVKWEDKEKQFVLQVLIEEKASVKHADKVIVACGSKAGVQGEKNNNPYQLAKKCNHTIIPVVPALVQLCANEDMKAVAGVRMEADLTLYIDGEKICKENGEVQLTEYGISGIPTFQLSRWAAYGLQNKKKVSVTINCLPDFEEEQFKQFANVRYLLQTNGSVEDFFLGILNKKVMLYFIKKAGLKPNALIEEVKRSDMDKVFELLRNWSLTIVKTNSFEQAQVCAGGVDLKEVDEHLESVSRPGLFFTGEILDVDGRCGGYNLQWAWSSGFVAGRHSAK